MGWVLALTVLLLLAALPIGVDWCYSSDGLRLQMLVGPVKILILPRRRKKKTEKNPTKNREKKSPRCQKKTPVAEKGTGGSIADFLPLLQTALDFLGDLRRRLRLDRLQLKLTLAGEDPCDLAVNYGRAWAAVGNLMPRLERIFVIKKRDIQVACDFMAERTCVLACGKLTITVARICMLAIRYGIRVAREYLNIINQRKGGMK